MDNINFKKILTKYCMEEHYSKSLCLACINLYHKVINNNLNKIDRLLYYKIISSQSIIFKKFHYYSFERKIIDELEYDKILYDSKL